MSIFSRIMGGWRTHGPSVASGFVGAFASDDGAVHIPVTAETVLNLSVAYACLSLRAETVGTLPLHLRDSKNNIIADHPLSELLRYSPNATMTGAEYWSLQSLNVDMYGNSYSRIMRRRDKSIISLEPMPTEMASVRQKKSGMLEYGWGSDWYGEDEIFHLKGFSRDGLVGESRLSAGRHIFAAQQAGNDAAANIFRSGLKAGGLLKWEGQQDMTDAQRGNLEKIFEKYSRPENAGKFLTLIKGLVPVTGTPMRFTASEAELLASRHFGIEEVCRLMATPPQLVGHTDKASSWASSLENVNMYYLQYGVQPGLIRSEQRISKQLVSPAERGKLRPKFSIAGLLRSDAKTRALLYGTGLQNGYYNVDHVRDLEELPPIPGGDTYRVQMNMAPLATIDQGEQNENQNA